MSLRMQQGIKMLAKMVADDDCVLSLGIVLPVIIYAVSRLLGFW